MTIVSSDIQELRTYTWYIHCVYINYFYYKYAVDYTALLRGNKKNLKLRPQFVVSE